MSDPTFHTGGPAFTSLMPEPPAAVAVMPDLAAAIGRYVGSDVEVQSLGPPGSTPEGRYVIHGHGAPLFLKIFDDRLLPLQLHANGVAAVLHAHGVPVLMPLDGEPRRFAANYHGELLPFVDGRFSNLSDDELQRLAAILAHVHTALLAFDHGAVREAAGEMHRRLIDVATAIESGWSPRSAITGPLRDAAVVYQSSPLAIHHHPQMIHGDCNYSNVLVDRHSDAVYLIDFEESRAAWLNPAFDLAKVIERFLLVPGVQDARAKAAGVITAYAAAGGAAARVDFLQVLLESNARALLILADKTRDGMTLPDAEWEKFVTLTALARRHADLLDAVSAHAARVWN